MGFWKTMEESIFASDWYIGVAAILTIVALAVSLKVMSSIKKEIQKNTILFFFISTSKIEIQKHTARCSRSNINGNTEQIEIALLKQEIEIGIVEGQSKNKSIKYTAFLKDELVLVCKSSNPLVRLAEVAQEELKQMQFLMREQGSGTLEVIEHALKPFEIKISELKIEMQLGSTESIKSYLMNSDCVAFISIHAIEKELKSNELAILDIKNLSIERFFYIITLQGKTDSLSDLFIQNIFNHYNLKL